MTWLIQPNGTINHWKTADGTDILFPETELQFGNEKKIRGGAPVCVPNFGTAPTDGPYEGIKLPKHGLVRTCHMDGDETVTQGNRSLYQSRPALGGSGWVSASYHFMSPWIHEVYVSAKLESRETNEDQRMHHSICLRTELIHGIVMPYSIGFHPYFSTAGSELFTLHYDGLHWSNYNLEVDKPFFVQRQGNETFLIDTFYGITELKLQEGYNGFYVWTDRPDLYICVEPVCVGENHRYRILDIGEQIECSCTMTFSPHK